MKNLTDFFTEYGELHDAVLRDVSFCFLPSAIAPTIKVVLDCMSLLQDDAWVYLEMTFQKVHEFRLIATEQMTPTVVESFAAERWGSKLIFDFAPNRVQPEGIAEHRDSYFYLVCDEFDFREISLA
ncbi:hypothetical protein [Hymenobacter siberiensis]|jgi:hypothetical protein|uniref:hypothetical protein n=1 Tax=Hymenobacter siberiensis TaxID=2848396 RepID=UPI001C1E2CCC|nr:hypothetical protein [Hymenobacter siberiensis]MBU6121077.1 hypothetical protein [Hymenobacter siberiensis]